MVTVAGIAAEAVVLAADTVFGDIDDEEEDEDEDEDDDDNNNDGGIGAFEYTKANRFGFGAFSEECFENVVVEDGDELDLVARTVGKVEAEEVEIEIEASAGVGGGDLSFGCLFFFFFF